MGGVVHVEAVQTMGGGNRGGAAVFGQRPQSGAEVWAHKRGEGNISVGPVTGADPHVWSEWLGHRQLGHSKQRWARTIALGRASSIV
jgi:hypothetical protein